MSRKPRNRETLPSDLGELFGFTESSGTWIAAAFTVIVLVMLIWAFVAASQAPIPVL